MRRFGSILISLAALALAGPALASAAEQTLTFTTGPISVAAYGVAQQPLLAESPRIDGYVVGMEAEVVDATGKVQGRDKVMLHHIVFAKVGTVDSTCGNPAERFFAEGEERLAMKLPAGYGYPNRATDVWGLLYMLMNHKPQKLNGYIRYTVRYVTGEQLTPVKPFWLDVRNCSGPDPVFDVPGGGKQFSTFTRSTDFVMPESGRLVSGGGHLHGGGLRLELRNETCGTVPFQSLPTWGGPLPRPILHEPGPTKMSQFTSVEGIPVARGDRLRLSAVYENSRLHTRVMGIMVVYLAPAEVTGCNATPALDLELGSPSAPPFFAMPLPRAPKGAIVRNAKSTWVGDFRYGAERLEVRRGSIFTWRFIGGFQHDVTVIGGPVGFSAPWTLAGTFQHRFTRAGSYRLFCSLHPARMVQQITVK